MLQRVDDAVKECLDRAEEARRLAQETANPGVKADLLGLEKAWRTLAKSCEASAQIRLFLTAYRKETDWKPASTAPFDCDLELAVLADDGAHALVFPTRRILGGWINAETKGRIDLCPTHWREWRKPASIDSTGSFKADR